jgi:hypothetical protein
MSWMTSLRGLRSYKQTPHGCCGRTYVDPIPHDVIKMAASHPDFLNDMLLLKRKLGVERVIINVVGCRTTL